MSLTINKNTEEFLLDFFVSKKWRIVRHIGLITALMIVLYSPPEFDQETIRILNIKNPEITIAKVKELFLLNALIALVMVYINLFVLIPRLLLKNKYSLYFFGCFVLVTLKYVCELVSTKNVEKYMPAGFFYVELSFESYLASSLVAYIFLIATAGYKIFKKWIYESKQLAELQEAKLKEELSNLKNQINPHFLFNTLNNLNTLITSNPSKASSVVLGLSDVLRFYLYEANNEKVMLKKDIEVLKQVLELEKIRREGFQFSIHASPHLNGIMLPPFLFTNFVENAIKHSANSYGFSYVNINFHQVENKLNFTCENSIPTIKPQHTYGGLGLINIKRRLNLLYADAYTLNVSEANNVYIVNLTIPL
jgi:two-component system, LytTR family, sensor kinase